MRAWKRLPNAWLWATCIATFLIVTVGTFLLRSIGPAAIIFWIAVALTAIVVVLVAREPVDG